jgi:hypothetical protein
MNYHIFGINQDNNIFLGDFLMCKGFSRSLQHTVLPIRNCSICTHKYEIEVMLLSLSPSKVNLSRILVQLVPMELPKEFFKLKSESMFIFTLCADQGDGV